MEDLGHMGQQEPYPSPSHERPRKQSLNPTAQSGGGSFSASPVLGLVVGSSSLPGAREALPRVTFAANIKGSVPCTLVS